MPPGTLVIGRRGFLAGSLVVLPLAACSPSTPPVVATGADDGYHGTALTDGSPMPDVALTDQDGKPYNLATSPTTKITALFFGYTNCPDVCPGILADMAVARRRLADGLADDVTLVMVSTDPSRDTPEVLKQYLSRIDESFVGLTGDLATISKIAAGMGIAIEEGKKLPSGGYEVDHGAQVLGVDSKHKVRVIWTEGWSVADLREDYAKLIAEG